ncbi:MAG: sulfatase-like hydrolase/transferase [Candidatus Aenigmarchaeota archaeon]|nr:sulfatase-like hydrolase/transferase [Candidatus Aenigmarchaeota archaeon]
MKKRNVIIFIIDGRRTYKSEDSKTTKLDYMYEFAKESIEFEYVSCSAPSTAMSLSAILSGVPSYYLSKTFVNLTFNGTSIPSLNRILEKNGYSSYGISSSFGQFFRETMNFDDSKYRLGIKKTLHHTYVNNEILKNLLPEMKEPFFLMMHYTRGDHDVVDNSVREGVKILKERGLFEDSVFLMTCDHGYPDPDIKRKDIDKLGHDLVVTDDNILVPFYIKYPGSVNGLKVKTMVTHLDIVPTILDLLGIYDQKPETAKGNSLLNIIKIGGKRAIYPNLKIRIDNRYINQPGRITAIRGPEYKYVYYHDKPILDVGGMLSNAKESFYDLRKDPREQINLIGTKNRKYRKEIEEFREFFRKSENEAVEYQKAHLKERRFYILRQLKGRKGDYMKNPCNILKDAKRQINLVIYRIGKVFRFSYTAFR